MPKMSSMVWAELAVSAAGENGSTSVEAITGGAGSETVGAAVLARVNDELESTDPVGKTAAIEPAAELSESDEPPFCSSSDAYWSDFATSGAVGFTPMAITKPITQGSAKAAPTRERSHTGGRGVESTERSMAAMIKDVGFDEEEVLDMMAEVEMIS